MAIASYDDLLNAINDYTDRSYSEARRVVWIGNAEAKFNRRLGNTYRRSISATMTTNSSGIATHPTGFVGLRSIVRNLTGSRPLKQLSWDEAVAFNPYSLDGVPLYYAIKGTELKVTPIVEDTFSAVYDALLTPLSSGQSNWLLALAPDIYLTMCLAEEALFTREFTVAAGLENSAYGMLDDLVRMDQVAQLGNVETVLEAVA